MMKIMVELLMVVLGRKRGRRKRRGRNRTRIVLIETKARAATEIGIMIAIERAAVDVTTRIRESPQVVAKIRGMIDPEGMRPHAKNEEKKVELYDVFNTDTRDVF